MSCQLTNASVNDRVPAGCACGHCEVESPASESSEDSPGNDCSCPNCICEGATLQDSVKLPDANRQPGSFGHWSAPIERDISVEIVQDFARVTRDCDYRIAGRDARITYQSWLI